MKLFMSWVTLLGLATAHAQYTCQVLPLPAGLNRARPTAIGYGKVVGTASGPSGGGACVWDGPTHSFRLLTPMDSGAAAVSVGVQGGVAGYPPRAFWWTDYARRGESIHPNGYIESMIQGMDGGAFVGWGTVPMTGYPHALLWRDYGSFVTELHPPGYERSFGRAVWGDVQVGVVQRVFNEPETAAIWSGNAASMRVLPTPHRVPSTDALSIRGNTIVGRMETYQGARPVMWKVDTLEFSELPMPTSATRGEYIYGVATGTNGLVHVGRIIRGIYPTYHAELAVAWVGDPPQIINLNQFLPPHLAHAGCIATGIDDQGNITGWAQSIYVGTQPVIWKPTR